MWKQERSKTSPYQSWNDGEFLGYINTHMSKVVYVYKITRTDDQLYIGITENFKVRMYNHRISDRFSIGMKSVEILHECADRSLAEQLEEYYIKTLDTFHRGLNNSINGRGNHLSNKFTTLGRRTSDQTKAKISKANIGKAAWNKSVNYETVRPDILETIRKVAKTRRGKACSRNKLSVEDVDTLKSLYDDITNMSYITRQTLNSIVKKSQHTDIEESISTHTYYDVLITKNGQRLNKQTIFAAHYSVEYGVTAAWIRTLIQRNFEVAKDYIQ